MLRTHFTPVVVLITLLTLSAASSVRAQEGRGDDGPDASASTDGVSDLDRDIAVCDSTRAAVAEYEARIRVDQARLDSLETALANAREAAPRDAVATRRAAEDVKAGRKRVAHDVSRTKRERELLAELEKKVSAELAALRKQADATNDVHHDITQDRSAERAHSESGHHR